MGKIEENPLAVKPGDIFIKKSALVTCSAASLFILFHKCWTHAVESTQYDKKEWQELVSELRKFGLEMQ